MNAYDPRPPRHRSGPAAPHHEWSSPRPDVYAPDCELEDEALEPLAEVPSPPPWFSLATGGVAISVMGALWLLSLALPAAWVAGGAAACTAGAAISTLAKVHSTGQALGWRIDSEGDLQVARAIAEMDMKSAAIMMSRVCGTLAFCLFSEQLLPALALVIFCIGFGPWATRVEGRFHAMESGTPTLAQRFSRIVRAWKEPRWSLPPEV
jgi:hypothetical protein